MIFDLILCYNHPTMNHIRWYLLAAGLVVAGGLLLFMAAEQPVTIVVDGKPVHVESRAFTVKAALREANLSFNPDDRVAPTPETWFFRAPVITIQRARPVNIAAGENVSFHLTKAKLAANILAEANIRLYPGDRIDWNGETIPPDRALEGGALGTLTVRQAQAIMLDVDGASQVIYSAAPSLGQALWEAGVTLEPADRLDPPAETGLAGPVSATLRRARPLEVTVNGQAQTVYSAAETVGQALAENNLALQGFDYSQPAEDQPVPPDGKIRLVRVQEVVTSTQKLLPNKTDYVADAQTELDHESVIDPGAPGIVMSRERVRYEDGAEVARVTEGEWTAQEPKNRQVGYGTKVVVRTMEVGGTTIEYWRAINVYATSYSPCRSGDDVCRYGTASGMKAQTGVVAVRVPWFLDMRGQTIYVPGYGKGVIGDTGGGIPGRYWIDLGYNDEDYQSWHQWVTIYFLTPVPPFIPYILYP